MNTTDRKTILLRAALEMLEKLANSPVVISPAETTVNYDEAECDGLCLIDDIKIELEGAEEEFNTSNNLHNPDFLTPEQVEVNEGWRLLDKNEIRESAPFLKEIQMWADGYWDSTDWMGDQKDFTYRTKLTPAELRKKRKQNDVSCW